MKRIISLTLTLVIVLSLVACGKESVEIILKKDKVTLEEPGETYKLRVSTDPENMEDELEFESEDEDIATVDEDGEITAVAPGKTVIVITCGDETAECKVICDFDDTSADSADPAGCSICGGDAICDFCDGFPICPTCNDLGVICDQFDLGYCPYCYEG